MRTTPFHPGSRRSLSSPPAAENAASLNRRALLRRAGGVALGAVLGGGGLGTSLLASGGALAQSRGPERTGAIGRARGGGQPPPYSTDELVDNGHRFFGSVSRGLALSVEEAVRRWGEPNGYILGQEGSGAFFGGLRYGEGKLATRNAGERPIFWQGPSIGFDIGGDGARTMMLVYNLPSVEGMYQRFVGVDGSAYVVGGFGFTALAWEDMVVVPIRAGVGARLGINLGYLKFTPQPTWNPF